MISNSQQRSSTAGAEGKTIRAAQTGVFHVDMRISKGLFIDVCAAVAAETGLKSRNVQKTINAV
jgi:hypothetical protein